MADFHEEALSRLCVVRGESVTKGFFHEVENCLELIRSGFGTSICPLKGIKPLKLFHSCHWVAQSVSNGDNMNISQPLMKWELRNAINCKT